MPGCAKPDSSGSTRTPQAPRTVVLVPRAAAKDKSKASWLQTLEHHSSRFVNRVGNSEPKTAFHCSTRRIQTQAIKVSWICFPVNRKDTMTQIHFFYASLFATTADKQTSLSTFKSVEVLALGLLQTCPHWNLPRIESVDWIEIWKVKKNIGLPSLLPTWIIPTLFPVYNVGMYMCAIRAYVEWY